MRKIIAELEHIAKGEIPRPALQAPILRSSRIWRLNSKKISWIRLLTSLRRTILRIFRTSLRTFRSRKIQLNTKHLRPNLPRGGIPFKIHSSRNSRIKMTAVIYRFCSKMAKVKDFRI